MAEWRSSQIDRDTAAMRVRMWDIGPKEPVAPKRPTPPKGAEGSPEYKLAMLDFDEAIKSYEAESAAYAVAKRDYDRWQAEYGGPIELDMASVDARDALTRDPARYIVSNPKKPNGGLPKGMKPGPAHMENMRRKEAELAEFEAVRRTDPVYGGLYT